MRQRYLLDGYNFLFRVMKHYKAVRQHQREMLLALNTWAVQLKLDIMVVFDGRQKDPPEATRGHLADLEVVYTPEHQTADDYILEQLDFCSNPSLMTIVSSDRELAAKAKQRGAKAQSIEEFCSFLSKKRSKKKAEAAFKAANDTPAHIERLLKIFEEKSQSPDNLPGE